MFLLFGRNNINKDNCYYFIIINGDIKMDKIKKIGKKVVPYVAAALMSLSLYAKADGASLPIYDDTKNVVVELKQSEEESRIRTARSEIDSLLIEYDTGIKEANDSFNENIADGLYDLKEQESDCQKYSKLNDLTKKIREIGSDHNLEEYKEYKMLEGESELYSLLRENLFGFDLGTPSLERKLKDDGIDVDVKGDKSLPEDMTSLSPFFLIVLLGGLRSLKDSINSL